MLFQRVMLLGVVSLVLVTRPGFYDLASEDTAFSAMSRVNGSPVALDQLLQPHGRARS